MSRSLRWLPLLVALLAGAVLAPAQEPVPVPVPPRLEVRVLPRAEVTGAEFTLGEVAELDGGDIEAVRRLAAVSLGRAPPPGRSLRLGEGFVRGRLAQAVDVERITLSVPAGAEVVRATQVLSGEDIAAHVLARAAEQAAAGGAEVEQELAAPIADAVLPKGEVQWEVEPLGRYLAAGGARTYRVVATVNGDEAWRSLVRVNQQVFHDVVLAGRAIGRNRIVGAGDVVVERRPVAGIKHSEYLTAPAQAVGRRAKRPIAKGEWIKAELLEAVADVSEGGPVQLVYQTEQVRFSTPGVALVPAKVGQFIPVRNLQSGKIVYGVVQADQSVKVN